MNNRLLIFTQIMDKEDTTLSFFHNWVVEFAHQFQFIVVVCLKKGKCELPGNVRVLSLGKEDGESKVKYVFNFVRYIVQFRKDYDAVFVHMNQEYVLLGGWLWKLLGKKIYMWRNHHAGSFLTDIAAWFCEKVFCTSKFSYTAKYKKTVLMPVGVNTEKFKAINEKRKIRNSILFLGRIAPSKNVHVFIEVLGLLKKQDVDFVANVYGDTLPKDLSYREKLKLRAHELELESFVKFHEGVPNYMTRQIYNMHEIFVNLSSSGMYDKTIFEAMACGCVVLASNDNLRGNIDNLMIIDDRTPKYVARKLIEVSQLSSLEKGKIINGEMKFAETHSLDNLSKKLYENICMM